MKGLNVLKTSAGAMLACFLLTCITGCSSLPSFSFDEPSTGSRLNTELYSLEKKGPCELSVGETAEYTITFCPKMNLHGAVVTDIVPEGFTVLSTEPVAEVNGQELSWRFPRVDANQTQVMHVNVKADVGGTFNNCVMASAVPVACLGTVVGEPKLTVCKTGPSEAEACEEVTFTIVVKNEGTFPAKDVVVKDIVPEGLRHESGNSEIVTDVGLLEAGESKTFDICLTTVNGGTHCNVVEVYSCNAKAASSQACVNVVAPDMEVMKEGPARQQVGEHAKYRAIVMNTGTMTLTDVVVTDEFARELELVEYSPEGRARGNSIEWEIDTLEPGEAREFYVTLTTCSPGEFCNCVTAYAQCEDIKKTSTACTEWKGAAALLTTLIDSKDPLCVANCDTTVYTITVKNQGTGSDTNVNVSLMFPEEVEPTGRVRAPVGHSVEGKTVVFEPVLVLEPQSVVTYKVEGRAVQEGDARVTMQLTSDELEGGPLSMTESTQVN